MPSQPQIPAPEGFSGCTGCREIKPLSEFYMREKGGDKPMAHCKPCRKLDMRARQGRPDPDAPARFWPCVNKEAANGCWEWTASLDGRGYGQFWYRGFIRKAHHVALIFAGIDPPKRKDGMCVDHICRNRKCVKLDHLRIVTDAVNALENNDNAFVRNHRKKECVRHHAFTPENTAIKRCTGPKGTPMLTRICLTCYPQNWTFAIVEREPPPRAKKKWVGPQKLED